MANDGETFHLHDALGARPVAVRAIPSGGGNGTVQYLHPEHLGRIGQITNASKGLVQDLYFRPYDGGVRWSANGNFGPSGNASTRRSYTGQYEEASQWMGSLMDYKARFYSPYLNRWLQPDTMVPSAGNPQTLNRFTYAADNPVRYNDPDGHCAPYCTAVGGAVVGAGIGLAI